MKVTKKINLVIVPKLIKYHAFMTMIRAAERGDFPIQQVLLDWWKCTFLEPLENINARQAKVKLQYHLQKEGYSIESLTPPERFTKNYSLVMSGNDPLAEFEKDTELSKKRYTKV